MCVDIDIIILSYAKNDVLKQTTLDGIKSLLCSEDEREVRFHILVIESNNYLKPYQYPHTKTIYPEEVFGYNKYLNIGINSSINDYICFCNNDLIYGKGWASEIVNAMKDDLSLLSASPYCPIFHKSRGFLENGPPLEGYFGTLGGWCIFVKREIFQTIGYFEEKLVFWYCDADYCNTLIKYNVKNCLIPASKVTHLGSESLKLVSPAENQKLTQLPRFYYSYKWVHHNYLKYMIQVMLFKVKMSLGRRI